MSAPQGFFQVRERGNSNWYKPERDLLNIFPNLVWQAALYAVDPKSSIYQDWLAPRQAEWAKGGKTIVAAMSDTLRTLMEIINESGGSPLDVVVEQNRGRLDWTMYQGVMMALGAVAMRAFSDYYRESRLKTMTGEWDEPRKAVDVEKACRVFQDKAGALWS